MKWHETNRGDLTDKLRGMIVKRIKEARKGPDNAGIQSAGSVRPDAGRNHLFYINHIRAGRRATGFYAVYLKALAGKEHRERYIAVFILFSNIAYEKRVVMHVISRDAAPGCPLRDSRRKPPSWKTCTWIDRFLYAIVAIVMPVALYKSLLCHALSFIDQRLPVIITSP